MSRKVIITLAAAATLAVAGLATTSSYARSGAVTGFGGRGPGTVGNVRGSSHPAGRVVISRRGLRHLVTVRTTAVLCVLGRPCPPRPPVPPIWVGHHHHHHHWIFRGGHWMIDDIVEEASVGAPAAAPGPCTCLTKTYTPAGLVVFADVCTKESASAPATEERADSRLAQPDLSLAVPQQQE